LRKNSPPNEKKEKKFSTTKITGLKITRICLFTGNLIHWKEVKIATYEKLSTKREKIFLEKVVENCGEFCIFAPKFIKRKKIR